MSDVAVATSGSTHGAAEAASPAGPAPASPAAAKVPRWLGERSLAVQFAAVVALAGVLAAALAVGVLRLVGALTPDAAVVDVRAAAAVLATALAASCAAAHAWGRGTTRALQRLVDASRALRHDDAADELQLPLLDHDTDLRATSHALRRLVDAHREQRRALHARLSQVGAQLEQRTQALSTLQDLSVGLAEASDLTTLIDEALVALEQTVDYASASVWARAADRRQVVLLGHRSTEADDAAADAASLRGARLSRPNLQRYEQIERSREVHVDNQARQGLLSWLWEKVVDDARTSTLYRNSRAWIGLPLTVRDQVLGVLRVDHRKPGFFDAERQRLLCAVASQTSLAMHHAQLLVQARDVAVVAERNRIARELHDAVSQTLFASNVVAGTLVRQVEKGGLPDDPSRLLEMVRTLERLNRGALSEMRMLLFELRPDALEGQPLPTLLQHPLESLACRGDLTIERDIAADDPLPSAVRVQVYRIAQEALSNLARHAGATHVHIGWRTDAPEGCVLTVRDDGQGFDPAAERPGHFGLDNMAERAREAGARLTVTSAPGDGTEIRLVVPRAGAAQSSPSRFQEPASS